MLKVKGKRKRLTSLMSLRRHRLVYLSLSGFSKSFLQTEEKRNNSPFIIESNPDCFSEIALFSRVEECARIRLANLTLTFTVALGVVDSRETDINCTFHRPQHTLFSALLSIRYKRAAALL